MEMEIQELGRGREYRNGLWSDESILSKGKSYVAFGKEPRKEREAVHLFSNIGSVQINNCFACM